jgi:hypothetical protein
MSKRYILYFFIFFQEFVLYESYAYFDVQSVDGRVHWSKISKHPIFGHKLKRHYPARLVTKNISKYKTNIALNVWIDHICIFYYVLLDLVLLLNVSIYFVFFHFSNRNGARSIRCIKNGKHK